MSSPDSAGAALDEAFRSAVAALTPAPAAFPPGYTAGELWELFEAQVASRHLDLTARRLGAARRGFYSIGSSGHEGNVALAAATRPTDPALLHYRSGAFFTHRARRAGVADPIRDVLLGVVAAAADPISGGRHKVFGSAAAHVIPQTSTIASHLPRAVGAAFALDRAHRAGVDIPWPADAVVLCTFGDASANHSTAVGAINAAVHTAYQGVPMPILFVCEDNGLGISVPTPPGWIQHAYGSRPGLHYLTADACDLRAALAACTAAVDHVRAHRAPVFLHLRTVRLLGHAGSDLESAYRRPADIAADLRRDPLLATARLLADTGAADPHALLDRYDTIAARVTRTAESVCAEPKLDSASAVIAPLAAARPDAVRTDVLRGSTTMPGTPSRSGHGGHPAGLSDGPLSSDRPSTPSSSAGSLGRTAGAGMADSHGGHDDPPVTLAQAINSTLASLMERDRDVLVFGEDVGRKGGVYGVTKGLRARFGPRRVFDTILDEQSVLGTALGAGPAGFVPIPEIQYLAYLHNAADQLRGEAATLGFFSAGGYRNPMVVRIAGLAYQKGFGGHFHNDNSLAALRDIPGLVLAVPARADDAAGLLRTCVSAARVDGRVCVLIEPIALYHTRDLFPGDGAWAAHANAPEHVEIGRARCYGEGTDLTIVTFGNGVPMSLRAASRLAHDGIRARILDLRWLAPLPVDDLLHHAAATGRVLVADETRRNGGVSEAICTALVDAGHRGALARVTSEDSFVPLGPAAATVLLDEDTIVDAARALGRA
ncbi:thiamine pyrophosphate-dependent enzyme [Nocardia shimofusensis]|uniref:thiamine pyrophosphate-dependent enzyme n=1 Tax=Nocardia shimofusensis TaxID=228596 RepID=UPI000831195B|nr:thiamine pyrophosphate-dependent enzyme [Nocardia shimofusensis]